MVASNFTNQQKLDDVFENIVDDSQGAFADVIAKHVANLNVQRQTNAGPVVNKDGTPSNTNLSATLAWLDSHITDLLNKQVTLDSVLVEHITNTYNAIWYGGIVGSTTYPEGIIATVTEIKNEFTSLKTELDVIKSAVNNIQIGAVTVDVHAIAVAVANELQVSFNPKP